MIRADAVVRPPRRVLVIDDDPAFRESVIDVLREAGYAVSDAANGSDAVRRAAAEDPDLVLVDYRMPGMTGEDVVQALRAQGFRGAVILVTATSAPSDLARSLGVRHALAKPFGIDDLLETVERAAGDASR